MGKRIDVHNHFYPREYLDSLLARTTPPRAIRTEGEHMVVIDEGDVITAHIDRPGHYDPAARIRDMDNWGLDSQVLSLTVPNVDRLEVTEQIRWARRTNDLIAEVCKQYSGRFYGAASLPLRDTGASVEELERAVRELGFRQWIMFSNVEGKPIDSPEFWPIYAKAEELGVPILIHPTKPLAFDAFRVARLPVQILGYTLDTSMAVLALVFRGVLERYPNLKLIHAHLGGVLPYLISRVESGFTGYAKEYGIDLPKRPSEYYKRNVYLDTCAWYKPAIECALETVGVDHIVLGTDYAHRVGEPDKAVALINSLALSDEDKQKIFSGNAERILGIK